MIRKIASVTALAITALSTISLNANTALANSNPVTVAVFNQGGYAADFEVSYTTNGVQKTVNSGDLVVGQKTYFLLPADSQYIKVSGLGRGMSRNRFFTRNARNGTCIKTFGTARSPQSNTSCPASDSFFYSGITRVFTKDAR
jgi:hypothetical protein